MISRAFSAVGRPLFLSSTRSPFMKYLLAPTLTFSAIYYQRKYYSAEEKGKESESHKEEVPIEEAYYKIAIDSDLKEGEMREVQVGPDPKDIVLVCKIEGKHYCVQSKCPHVGAPLGKGLLFDDKVVCPFHNAAFSVITGYPEMGPVFDGISTYEIREESGKLHIKVPKSKLNVSSTVKMTKRNPLDKRRYVIVGAGPAALSCAETLRQSGFEGEIVMIGEEDALPYDRTNLSKWIFGSSLNNFLLRKEEFFSNWDINLKKKTKVCNIDFENNTVFTNNTEPISFDKLLLATGGTPRKPRVPGVNLENVLVLRNIEDQINLKNKLKSEDAVQNIVIIGASFIGMETASAIKKELKDKVNITVVDIFKAPFERVLGKEVGSALGEMHKSNGINLLLEKGLKSLNGENKIASATLTDGTILPADIVLLGTGISPNISLGKIGGLEICKKNRGFQTDAFLRTSRHNVFAAGDAASFPYWQTGNQTRIEHYNEAISQGSIAALNMLGKHVPMSNIPFFWTRQWDKSLQYTGFAESYDDVFIDGNLNELKFAAYYLKGDRVVAVAAMNQMNLIQLYNEAMRLNLMPTATEFKQKKVNIQELKQKILGKKPASRCKRADCCKNK